MERALLREIGELERSIGELTRRKARRAGAVTSPEWQTPAVRVSRRPDGFSGRQDNPASSYLAQLELAAQLGGWTPEQIAGHLALALQGPALEAILDLPPAERQNLQALTAALQRRFIQHRSAEASWEKLPSRYRCEEESWGKVAADVQRYACEAYPEFDAAAQEKLVLHAFLRALTPERLRDNVSLAQPGSISEALIKTTRAEDTLAIRPTPQPTRQHVRVADGEEVHWTRTPLQRPAGRQGRCDEPGHIARDCPAPAPKPRKPPLSGNEAGTAHPALPAPVAKIPATSAEASTSAFGKATERKSHPRVGRLGKASGLYLHCRLDGQACRALVDTGATISLVRPGVLHNTGGPQLPGAWTPNATPLTSVTGAKMVMRGKKEVKVTVSGQEVSHEFWLADIADSCIIGLDLLKRWGACVDVSRANINLGTETPAKQQPPAQPKPALPAETTAAVHALWQRSSSGLDHQQRQQLKSLLDANTDLFAVRDEDCTQTKLVQHTLNTDTAQPIHLWPHRMSPAKRLVAEEKEGQSMAFDQLRAALTEAPVLAYPDAQRPFIIETDASNTGVGAVLSQEDEDGERVVAYYSRALGKAECNYCVTRRELLAMVRALHHFRLYLQGSHFLLRTEHASLTWLLNFKDPEGQVACWLEQLQGYDFEIWHRAGRLHGNADALSRRPCAAQECRYCSRQEERDQVSPDVAVVQASGDAEGWLPLTPMELRKAQEADSTLGKVWGWLEAGQRPERSVVSAESPELKSYYSLYSSLVQRDGFLYRRWQAPGRGSDILQLLVPRALRPDVLRLVHGSVGAGHFGNNKTLHRLRGKFHCRGVVTTSSSTSIAATTARHRKGLINAPEHPCNNTWSAVQESSQLTPAALVFGRELRTPVDLVFGAPPEPEEPSRTRVLPPAAGPPPVVCRYPVDV
ncbi:hypothetical protein SKAU_G00130840 [Synaphobranchus kaupii]|uniref:Gypsy retrotransposon integrase-like protein 1 n=1 Tax=Synaphobranchus kaupii TaxID=118154 RepID=A0A9Q1FRD7_SYNKA|nr:hypothetical protein SKAU_G00130840 [Synaphobranchus kaupii]